MKSVKKTKKTVRDRISSDNEIPDEILLEAGIFANAFMKLPPISQKELKEILNQGKKKN